jgi:hypothetical protein
VAFHGEEEVVVEAVVEEEVGADPAVGAEDEEGRIDSLVNYPLLRMLQTRTIPKRRNG